MSGILVDTKRESRLMLYLFHHLTWLDISKKGAIYSHNDVIKWKHFPRYWKFVRGIHRSPVNSPHKGQWRGALMFSLICARINGWVNNRKAGDLRRHRAHYDVIAMVILLASHIILCYRFENANPTAMVKKPQSCLPRDLCWRLAHWCRDKMAAIFQTTFSNAHSRMKIYESRLKYHGRGGICHIKVHLVTSFEICWGVPLMAGSGTIQYGRNQNMKISANFTTIIKCNTTFTMYLDLENPFYSVKFELIAIVCKKNKIWWSILWPQSVKFIRHTASCCKVFNIFFYLSEMLRHV